MVGEEIYKVVPLDQIGEAVPVTDGTIYDWSNGNLALANIWCDGERIPFVESCKTGKQGWVIRLERDYVRNKFVIRNGEPIRHKVYGKVEVEFK